MKKAIVYLTLVLLSNFTFKAQNWAWAKDMGQGTGYDIETDAQGNIYLLAGTGSVYANYTLTCGIGNVIAKHDSLGNLIWARGFNFEIGQMSLDKMGNIYVSGSFQLWSPTLDYFCGGNNPNISVASQGGADMYICKYSNNGDLLWVKTWAGYSTSNDVASAAKTDLDGNTIIAGYSTYQEHPYAQASTDHFILKYDTQGNLLWSKSNNYHGGMITKGLDIDSQGNFYIAGAFRDSAYFDNIAIKSNNFETVYIAKYNSNGSIIWAKKDGTGFDNCGSISLDNKGNFYITGNHSAQSVFSGTTLTHAGMFVAKYDTSGNALWIKNTKANFGRSVRCDTAGGCFVTGNFSGSVNFGPNYTLNTQKNLEVYVARYDKIGNLQWAVSPIGGAGSGDNVWGLCADNKNQCFISGSFLGNTIFGNTTLSGGGIFIAKLKDITSIITNTKKNNLVPDNELKIYPNPVRNFVSVSYTAEENMSKVILRVKNICGQLIFSESFNVNAATFTTQLNLEEYAKGLYFIELEPVSITKASVQGSLLKKVVLE